MTNNKKDFWDKFSSISTFISTVVIAIIGIIISESYKERQDVRDNEVKKVEVLEKFIPHLSSENPVKVTSSILAIYNLGLDEMAIQLSSMMDNEKTLPGTSALIKIYANATDPKIRKQVENILKARAEAGSQKQKKLAHSVFRGYHWILDNGHGEDTKGKRSPEYAPNKQLKEGDFNRIIVNKLYKRLKEEGVNSSILVPEKTDIDIEERFKRIDKEKDTKPRIYLAVHANSIPSPNNRWSPVNGIEVYYRKQDNSSKEIANTFINSLVESTGANNRGIKTANFYLLENSNSIDIPAILIESGFLTNKEELQKLLSDNYQDKIVEGLLNAIKEINEYGI